MRFLIVGGSDAGISAALATALFSGLRVDELSDLDLSYTPPLSSPWDPVQMAAHRWATAIGSEKKESSCKR